MKTKVFAIFSSLLVLCWFVGFFHFSDMISQSEKEADRVQYWDAHGNFIYTGAVISTATGSQDFFTGAISINDIKTTHSNFGDTPRFYIEYPDFASIPNIDILSGVRSKIMTISTEDVHSASGEVVTEENNEKNFGYDAHFYTLSGKGLGAIVYDIHKHNSLGDVENAIKKVFIIQPNGKRILPSELLESSGATFSDDFSAIVTEKFSQDFSDKALLPTDSIKQNVVWYLQDPQFAFSGSEVVFYMNSGIFSSVLEKNIELMIPYDAVSKIIRLEPKVIPPPKVTTSKKSTGKSIDGKKYVALTFDDGPHPKYTPWLLDTLNKKNVDATFFILWKNVAGKEAILQRMAQEGNEIASHSWSHPSFAKLSNQNIRTELQKTEVAIREATGITPKLFRPPYGAFTDAAIKTINMPIVMWSVDSRDWKNRNVDANIKTTLAQVHDGAIILFHDIHKESVETIPALIDALRSQGYEFLTVSQLYKKYYNSKTLLPEQICYSMKRC